MHVFSHPIYVAASVHVLLYVHVHVLACAFLVISSTDPNMAASVQCASGNIVCQSRFPRVVQRLDSPHMHQQLIILTTTVCYMAGM